MTKFGQSKPECSHNSLQDTVTLVKACINKYRYPSDSFPQITAHGSKPHAIACGSPESKQAVDRQRQDIATKVGSINRGMNHSHPRALTAITRATTVPVVDKNGRLAPTTCSRAAKLVKARKATAFWYNGVWTVRLNNVVSTSERCMVGDDLRIAPCLFLQSALHYEYGCIEVPVPKYLSSYFLKEILAERLAKGQLHEKEGTLGVESDSHISLIFGIKDSDQEKAIEAMRNTFKTPLQVKTSDTLGYFDKDAYSVVYVPIESPELVKLYDELSDIVPFTSEYSEYKPHMTLAYIEKGTRLKDDKIPVKSWTIPILVISNTQGELDTVAAQSVPEDFTDLVTMLINDDGE